MAIKLSEINQDSMLEIFIKNKDELLTLLEQMEEENDELRWHGGELPTGYLPNIGWRYERIILHIDGCRITWSISHLDESDCRYPMTTLKDIIFEDARSNANLEIEDINVLFL